MTQRHLTYLTCAVVVLATGMAAAPSTARPTVHRVPPGASIQKAVDAAEPGDTVVLSPGTYEESVDITTPDLTLRGSGAHRTVLVPDTDADRGACAGAGHGICVTGTDEAPLKGVTVRSLTLRGFTGNGLWATGTDRLRVQGVTAEKNGKWGIAEERSVRGVLSHNVARDNGDAGLFLANTTDTEEGARDARGTVVRHNRTTGNRVGVTVRRLRNLTVDRNEATGNCAAVFVVGDESKPVAGDLRVTRNHLRANNKHCAATPRLPFLQGTGIVLTGVEDTLVAGNRVENHRGTSPLSGGIVLFKSFEGSANERNTVRGNLVTGNSPADLADRDTATTNTFSGNTCTLSEPAGLC
ncbi:right-handed parallel beta-helix repeat-containing protein [Streptomyces prasinus]|uniref:right-handed parallel beta-helix repeat-containing protein n=1 Tax=Streptomyces prasinus TaxID=67345 RepID=UPI0006EBBE60|nr:right-handed parallel beta-helix repeat-containing protein [Streptomyces prasinus]